jgi:hypothetical protein
MPAREISQTESGCSQLVAFSRPKPGLDRRQSRDFGGQCPQGPAETNSAAERARSTLVFLVDQPVWQRADWKIFRPV